MYVILNLNQIYHFYTSFRRNGVLQNKDSYTSNFNPQKLFCYSSIDSSYTDLLITDHGVSIPAGYARMNFVCMGKSVYCNSKANNALTCIVEDRTGHIGGVWKGGSRKWAESGCPSGSRSGTYNASLQRIGD